MKCARKFERDVLKHLPQLRQRARQFTHRQTGADDLVQETLLKAWNAWGNDEIENVWGWLFLIMRNTHFQHSRDAKRRGANLHTNAPEVADFVTGRPPASPDADVTAGLPDEVLEALSVLTPTQRTVIELQLSGLDNDAIAKRLGIQVEAARTTSSKARARLREALTARSL